MRLVVASSNEKKRKEIAAILGELGIEIVAADQTLFVEVEEDADCFSGNARLKAEAFAEANQCAALADDSGLCVDALNGAPGVYSSRFAGANASDTDNNKKLLRDMQGIENRTARFACALHLSLPGGRSLTAEGSVEGVIRRSPAGDSGFGYDPLFFCPELGKVFAEASAEEKASVSHRARALRILAGKLARLD